MKRSFFARYSMIILLIIAFFTPFAMRGARIAVSRIKNDVKDWLPADFAETSDLDWFREHFLGEQFVIVSWEGCTGKSDDLLFQNFVDNLFPEVPPSLQQRRKQAKQQFGLPEGDPRVDNFPNWRNNVNRRDFIDDELDLYTRSMLPTDLPPEEEFVGNQLGLYTIDNDFENWGGQQEKWLKGADEIWYYITPDGDLYRWADDGAIFAPIINAARRMMAGNSVSGEKVASFGEVDGPWYYEDPNRLSARLFKSVTTGPSVLAQLTKNKGQVSISREEGIDRLEGYLFGRNRSTDPTQSTDTELEDISAWLPRQTCIVLTLTDAAKQDLRRAIGRGILGKPRGELLKIAEKSGVHAPRQPSLIPPAIGWMFPEPPPEETPAIKIGGPPVDNVAIDEEGQITLVRLLGFSLLVGISLSWISFRSFAITMMVFLVGGLSAVISVSIIYWSDSSVDAIMLSMPSLVYVLGLSGAVHIVNYYRETVQHLGTRGATERAIKLGWRPCTLAAITTALGLISLCASEIQPIKKFGLFSATGVLATLILLFTFLPAAIQLYAPARFRRPSPGGKKRRIELLIEKMWQRVGQFVIRRHRGVLAICVCTLGMTIYGCIHFIKTDVQLLKMFDSEATIIGHYEWLENNLGELIPVELVVKVDKERQLAADSDDDSLKKMLLVDRLALSNQINKVLHTCFRKPGEERIGQTMAANTFIPELPKGGTPGSFSYRANQKATSATLQERIGELVETDYLRYDEATGDELWRISVRLGALSGIDYAPFIGELKQVLEPVLNAYRYRDRVVDEISAMHKTNSSLRQARVLVAGAPLGSNSRDIATGLRAAATSEIDRTDPTVIFAASLLPLIAELPNASVTGWYDPNYEPPNDWAKVLDSYDLVLQVGDCEGLESANSAKARILDLRDHKFELGVSETAKDRGDAISIVYTGLVPVVYKAQRTLLESLIESTGYAFVMIAIVMMLVLRSPLAGLFSMIPNVFPVFAIFGYMCWSGIEVDIGSMMTASVAMGVAVDDTIHFMTWFRAGLDQGLNRYDAILMAYKRVATAMTQTTLIGGLGLAVFAFSTFTPTQRFGVLMLALLLAALVG
ncbi:MAG: MMPL family transporter, partial [Planctomycetales bacterium]|nr:MMPL family transporter [Planctomycetales bacterium]